jgi:hypothetical protein
LETRCWVGSAIAACVGVDVLVKAS